MNKTWVIIGWTLIIIGIIFMLNSYPNLTGMVINENITGNASALFGLAGMISGILVIVLARKRENLLT
ncbi:MAG: hypothetical protein N3D20_01020 [Candidatus Pacearchaeota archaeon]|nr:hypothetical protein [Candidatus Pacearchaeota archaeon]